jgi:hypothetical protein
MIREMARPTEAFEMVIARCDRAVSAETGGTDPSFHGPEMGRVALLLHIQSIISMVIHFNFARNSVMRITGMEYDDRFTDELVEHVVQIQSQRIERGRGKGSVMRPLKAMCWMLLAVCLWTSGCMKMGPDFKKPRSSNFPSEKVPV